MADDFKNIDSLKNSFDNWEPDFSPDEMIRDWKGVSKGIHPGLHFSGTHSTLFNSLVITASGIAALVAVYVLVHHQLQSPGKINEPKQPVEVKKPDSVTAQSAEKIPGSLPSGTMKIMKDKGDNQEVKSNVETDNPLSPVLKKDHSKDQTTKGITNIISNLAGSLPILPVTPQDQNISPVLPRPQFPEMVFGQSVPAQSGKISVSDTIFCIDDSLIILNTSSGQLYLIMPSNSQTYRIQNSNSFKFNLPGTYTLKLKYDNAGTEAIKTLNVRVLPKPRAEFSLDQPDPPEVRFINETKNAILFFWNFGDEVSSNLENPSHRYGDTGNYRVTMVAIASNGCRDTASNNIYVHVNPHIKIPNVFSPNNDGINDFYLVEITGESYFQLGIYDGSGQIVFSTEDKTVAWDGRNKGKDCPAGVYYLVLKYRMAGEKKGHTIKNEITLFR